MPPMSSSSRPSSPSPAWIQVCFPGCGLLWRDCQPAEPPEKKRYPHRPTTLPTCCPPPAAPPPSRPVPPPCGQYHPPRGCRQSAFYYCTRPKWLIRRAMPANPSRLCLRSGCQCQRFAVSPARRQALPWASALLGRVVIFTVIPDRPTVIPAKAGNQRRNLILR